MRTSKNSIGIQWVFFILAFILMFYNLGSCKSPESPTEPETPQYRDVVEVIYTRDTSKADPSRISDPSKKNTVNFEYTLYDLSRKFYDDGEIYSEESKMRLRAGNMEMISENKFRLYLKHVLIQQKDWNTNHKLILHDHVFFFNERVIEPKDIKIDGAYDIVFDKSTSETFNAKIYFKMSK